MADKSGKAAEAAKKFVQEASIRVFGAAAGLGTAATKAKNFVIDWATGGSEDDDNVDFGDGLLFDFDAPGGPNEQGARRVAPAVKPAMGSRADVVAALKPRQANLPVPRAALRIEGGQATFPEPYAGTFDIHL